MREPTRAEYILRIFDLVTELQLLSKASLNLLELYQSKIGVRDVTVDELFLFEEIKKLTKDYYVKSETIKEECISEETPQG